MVDSRDLQHELRALSFLLPSDPLLPGIQRVLENPDAGGDFLRCHLRSILSQHC